MAGLTPAEVSAVIVTRGDVPLDEIHDSFPEFGEVIVWTNGQGCWVGRPDGTFFYDQGTLNLERMEVEFPDVSVYGRYAAIKRATLPVVYVQDDDCIIPDIAGLLARYEPGRITANMPKSRWADYPDSCLVGWGAVFDRDLPARAFGRAGFEPHVGPFPDDVEEGGWQDLRVTRNGTSWTWPSARAFQRDCDVVFTSLTPHRKFDLGFRHLPWAETPGRLFRQPEHARARAEILAAARACRDSWPELCAPRALP